MLARNFRKTNLREDFTKLVQVKANYKKILSNAKERFYSKIFGEINNAKVSNDFWRALNYCKPYNKSVNGCYADLSVVTDYFINLFAKNSETIDSNHKSMAFTEQPKRLIDDQLIVCDQTIVNSCNDQSIISEEKSKCEDFTDFCCYLCNCIIS